MRDEFWAGFEKCAKKKEKKSFIGAGRRAVIGAGVGSLAAAPATLPLAYARGNAKENADFIDKMRSRHNLRVYHQPTPSGIPHGVANLYSHYAHFTDGSGVVVTHPKAPVGIVAHEMGHAKDLQKSHMPVHVRTLMRLLGPVAGMGAGAAAASSDNDRVQKAAPYIGAAGFLPTLSQEAKATYHGTKEIARQLGKRRALKSLAVTAPAFATYLGAPVGVGYALHRYVKKHPAKKTKK